MRARILILVIGIVFLLAPVRSLAIRQDVFLPPQLPCVQEDLCICPDITRTGTVYPQRQTHTAVEFEAYWQANGGWPVFGYPISAGGGCILGDNGRYYLGQWFERERLEYHPENQGEFVVLLGALGTANARMHGETPNPILDEGSIDSRFQAWWHRYGLVWQRPGQPPDHLHLFGWPITPPNRIKTIPYSGGTWQGVTQWTERARFEYHTAGDGTVTQDQVLPGLLGDEQCQTCPYITRDEIRRLRGGLLRTQSEPEAQAPSIELDGSLNRAAQDHANYLVFNLSDPDVLAQDYTIAGRMSLEKPENALFKGVQPLERARVAGFKGRDVVELIAPVADARKAVDYWANSDRGRNILMDPKYRYLGYGFGQMSLVIGGTRRTLDISVLELGTDAGQ